MIKQRKLGILLLAFALLFTFSFLQVNTEVEAGDNLVAMTKGDGSALYYRNSSERVYMLEEYDYPTAEYRAVWVSTFVSDIPAYTTEEKFKADATEVLDNLVRMGMNAMVFHVRTHNNALYNSDLNPIASWWKLVDFDKFDPLTWLIDETHKRGIEFHAWMNPYRITDGFVGEAYPEGHPCLDPTQVLTSGTGAKILDPGSERVQDFIVDTCMEFLDRYDADAIHFDDYFYIDGVAENISANQKRANVDAFIEKLSNEMHEMNEAEGRAVLLGISPSGIYRNGSYSAGPTYDSNGNLSNPVSSNTAGFAHYGDYLYSDTKKWVDEEWIDYITPQTYWGIEHTVASFAELSRWWSWAVRYKKVNLYLGVGIYMADSTGSSGNYWRKNVNEVQNQILNAGQYDEVKGMCYYKYTYLFSDNEIIKKGVNLFTNDYYAKRIPGVVSQRYATSLPSIKVSNINYVNGVLSWDAIDNVFGYMVYQVPKGQPLDTNNIDHVLVYTQDTEVANIDTVNYDYYVSSVNRANVKSTPVQFGAVELKDYEAVIANINSLPTNISLDNEAKVVSIREAFAALSEENQLKVTNIQTLINAESAIVALKGLKAQADTFIESIDTRINTTRVLPVGTNMKWSYVNPTDANKYNITTGKRLVNYIGSMPIELYLEVTDGTYTHKEIVEFDLCMLQESQVGLYYRNDPSAVSEHHVGQYSGTASFIGWSNAILTIGDYVLFVADGNYHEITSSTIDDSYWTSCGGAYINKSSSTVSMTLSQAFSTASPTYGYIVIGSNNTIKKVSETSPATEVVTLAPNESLYIIRYLDRLFNDTPFTDLSNFYVGQPASLKVYSETVSTPQDEGEVVVALINTIPSNVTLNDEVLVNSIKAQYDALSDDAKTYVSNVDVLNAALSRIFELKEELHDIKLAALAELNAYPNLDNYSLENQIVIQGYLSEGATKINNAITNEEVQSYVVLYKSYIDSVLTIEAELVAYKEAALNRADTLVDKTLYSEANQATIDTIISTLKSTISTAESKIVVDQAIDIAKSGIAQLKTLAEELEAHRQIFKDEISNYSSNKSYSTEGEDKIAVIVYNACTQINQAKSYDEMVQIVNTAKASIDAIPTKAQEILIAKEEAVVKLNNYVDSIVVDPSEAEHLVSVVEQEIIYINAQTSVGKVNNALNVSKANVYLALMNYLVDSFQSYLTSLFPLKDYAAEEQAVIQEKINSLGDAITNATTRAEIEAKTMTIAEEIVELPTLEDKVNSKKNDVIKYLDSILEGDLTEEQLEKVEQMVAEKKAELQNATTLEEVSNIEQAARDAYVDILANKTDEPENPSSNTCTFAGIKQLITISTLLSLLVVVIRKRK